MYIGSGRGVITIFEKFSWCEKISIFQSPVSGMSSSVVALGQLSETRSRAQVV